MSFLIAGVTFYAIVHALILKQVDKLYTLTSKTDHCLVKKILELKTELPKVLWWWSPNLKPNLSNSIVYSFCPVRQRSIFLCGTIRKGRMCLLAFRNHSLVLRPVDMNHGRLCGGGVSSHVSKAGLPFADHLFECMIFTPVDCPTALF